MEMFANQNCSENLSCKYKKKNSKGDEQNEKLYL